MGELESGKAGTVKTENGLEIEADVVIVVIGDRVVPTAYQDGLGESSFFNMQWDYAFKKDIIKVDSRQFCLHKTILD